MIKNSKKDFELGLPSIGIPSEVLFNPMLSSTEKILFGFIRNLSQGKRGCWATNNYLASLFIPKVTTQTISNSIAKLKKYVYINVEFVKQSSQSGSSKERRIYINNDYPKLYRPIVEMVHQDLFSSQQDDLPSQDTLLKNLYTYIKKFIGGYKKIYNIEYDIEDGIKYEKKSSKEDWFPDGNLSKRLKLTRSKKPTPKKKPRPKPVYVFTKLSDYSKTVQNLFNHWQGLGIKSHNRKSKTRDRIFKLLTKISNHYKTSEIIESMDNYKKLLDDPYSILDYSTKLGLDNFIEPDSYARKTMNREKKLKTIKSLFTECLKDDLSHLMKLGKDKYPELTEKIKEQYLSKIDNIKITSIDENSFRKTSTLLTEFWNTHLDRFNLHPSENRNVIQFLPIFIEYMKGVSNNGDRYPGLMCYSLSEKSGNKFYYWLKKMNYFRSKSGPLDIQIDHSARAGSFDEIREY